MSDPPALSRLSGELQPPDQEWTFRRLRLAEMVRHLRHVVWLASVFYLGFLLWDYAQLGWTSDFEQRALARVMVFVTGLFVAARLPRVREPGQLTGYTVLYVAAVMAGYVAVIATHPPLLITHVSMLVVLALIYFTSPARFSATVALVVASSLIYLASIWWFLRPELSSDFGPFVLLFALAVLSGALLLRRFNGLVRGQYISAQAEQRAMEALRQSEEHMRRLFMAVPVPLLLLRVSDGRLLAANQAGCSCAGYAPDRISEVTAENLFGDGLPYGELAESMDEGVAPRELEMRCAEGSRKDVLVAAARLRLQDEESLMVGLTDITERKRLEAVLRQLAATDQLTGLYNRHYFLNVAEAEVARARRHQRPLSVMMLDIDHFKSINDSYGHAVGDHVLRMFAGACRTLLRQHDVISRYGGEEFAILLPETALDAAVLVAERLRQTIAAMAVQGPGPAQFHFTVSIGVTQWCNDDGEIEQVLQRADAALYGAKHKGRNLVEVPLTTAAGE